MAKSKRFSPPSLIVATIFLVAAIAVLAAAIGAVQGAQDLFTQASGVRVDNRYTNRTKNQIRTGCVPRPSCLDEKPACDVILPAGVKFCDRPVASPELEKGKNPGLGSPVPLRTENPRMLPIPSTQPRLE